LALQLFFPPYDATCTWHREVAPEQLDTMLEYLGGWRPGTWSISANKVAGRLFVLRWPDLSFD